MALYYHLHIQPSEIENMPYYEYEITLENLHDLLKEKNDAERKAHEDQTANTPNYNKMANSFKAPSMPKFRMPKV